MPRLRIFLISLTLGKIHSVFLNYIKMEIEMQISLAVKSKKWNFVFSYGTAVERELEFPLHNEELLVHSPNHKCLAFNVFRGNIHIVMIIKHTE